MVSQQETNPISKPQGGLKKGGGQAQAGGKAHYPALRNRKSVPRGACLAFPGATAGHTHCPLSTARGTTLRSHHISHPRLPGLPEQHQSLGREIPGSRQEYGRVQGRARCQFKCSDSRRFCCPQPAPFLDPTLYIYTGRKILRAATPNLRNLHGRRCCPRKRPSTFPK